MKCRRKKVLISLVAVLMTIVRAEWQEHDQINNPNRNIMLGCVENIDQFPNEDYTDSKHHKIVKKQMATSSDTNLQLLNNGKRTFSNDANKWGELSPGTEVRIESLNEHWVPINKNFGRRKKSSKMSKDVAVLKHNQRRRIIKSVVKSALDSLNPNESLNGRTCICRTVGNDVDQSFCHNYFEWDIEPNGYVRLRRAKYRKDNQIPFEYGECLEVPLSSADGRSTRELICYCSKKQPSPGPDNDSEPSNEWLDAPQGSGPKIPSEFKPKPKLKLKIYHLRCRRALHRGVKRLSHVKQSSLNPLHPPSKANYNKERIHRHHPQSFVVKLNKKQNEDEEGFNDGQESEDDEDEDYEEDEYEETEDDTNESKTKSNAKENEKLNRKEGLKDLFKSAKDAVVSRIKVSDTNPTQKYEAQIGQKTKASLVGETEKPNKVLIDAHIKVDEEIGTMLKNILSRKNRNS
ncbi:hypothetical protein RUM44_004951 [Polyplax serrata]|uniref:Uncharacterized protein n=1 Tax=Polyplax serrata TaxID=468196 RepID=A0ABR1AWI3_POLSC